jgi:hypothetical protein
MPVQAWDEAVGLWLSLTMDTTNFTSGVEQYSVAQSQAEKTAAMNNIADSVFAIASAGFTSFGTPSSPLWQAAGATVGLGAVITGFVSTRDGIVAFRTALNDWNADPTNELKRDAVYRNLGDAVSGLGTVISGLGAIAWGLAKTATPWGRALAWSGIGVSTFGFALKYNPDTAAAAASSAATQFRQFSESAAGWRDAFHSQSRNATRNFFDLSDSVADFFNDARNWALARDPFALDLDGDGLETTGDMGRTTVLFDHDADGILAGTGWLRGDDAWLVLDRDGDSLITSGAELFGVDTPLATGIWDTVTLANTQRTIFRDGFSAIAPLDTNRDGRIDASDGAVAGWSIRRDLNADGVIGENETRLAQASDLRIWRDANVNGRVDSGELLSFTEANLVSINVNRAWQGRTALGNGNELIATGSYTRSDNTTRGTGALNLGVHSFYRSFVAPQDVAPSATGLPALEWAPTSWTKRCREQRIDRQVTSSITGQG